MQKSFKKLFTLLLAALLMTSHLNVTFASADELADPSEFGPVTEVEKEPTFNTPILGELDEEEDEELHLQYKSTDIVRVSIVLEGKSALDAGYSAQGIGTNKGAISYRNSLKKQQDKVAAQISSKVLGGKALDVKWNLTLADNIISAEVPYGKINQIKMLDSVKDVFIENRYEPAETTISGDDPHMVTSTEMTQSNGEHSSLYTGAGSRIAIIDTGLDIDHQSFDPDAFMHSVEEGGFEDKLMTAADVEAVQGQLNVPGYYLNEKIPYAYNYVDGNENVTHLAAGDMKGNHGSHVAGIAAANKYVLVDGEYVDSREAAFVVGQAPDAQIFVMKVFGVGGGAFDSDYFAAIEDAIVLGADSVNLSLGSRDPGFIFSDNYQELLDSLTDENIVVVFSAGNNSSWDQVSTLYSDDINYSSGGTPGTYINTFSVASVDNDGYTGEMLDVGGDKIEFNESSGYANKPFSTIPGEYEYVYIDGPGMLCNPADYYGSGTNEIPDAYLTWINLFAVLADEFEDDEYLVDKIAVCNRGQSSFFAKANGAVLMGAVGTIIINNQPGMLGMNLTGLFYENPVAMVYQDDGAYFKDNATSSGSFEWYDVVFDDEGETVIDTVEAEYTYYIGKITVSDEVQHEEYNSPNYTMSDFSSWGVPGSLTLKPEVSAPGGNIWSLDGFSNDEQVEGELMGGHDQYTLMSGTSMAAPQITGIIGAIGQYYRENDIEEKTGLSLRQFALSLIMSTATPLKDEEDCYYPVLQQGSGLVNVEAVVTATSFIHMSEDDDNLTAMTGAAADYKVKAELGDDPDRTGKFEYTFELTNFSDKTIRYGFSTDLFTQDTLEAEEVEYLTPWTVDLDGNVTYNIIGNVDGHDFDKDGDTDSDDAQAILDYVTGLRAEEDCDLEAGKLDEDDEVTTRDAYLLLEFLETEFGIGEDYIYLPAGETATVTVKIDVSGTILEDRENGGYVEGYTFVTSDDDADHSIPVLGYYGSWTDPSMYDAVTYVEQAMGSSAKESYFGATETNGFILKYADGRTAWFSGNPYIAEPDIDEERFAINGETLIKNGRYTTIRNAIAQLFVIRDGEGNIIETSNFDGAQIIGAYYNSQQETPAWLYTGANNIAIGKTPTDIGVDEGQQFSVEIYTVPEYYGVLANEGKGNTLTEDQLLELIENESLGAGAVLGYKLTVDNKAPEIISFEMNEDKTQITVTAKDDNYIAFIGLTDIQGNEVLIGEVPKQSAPGEEVTVTIDVSEIEDLPNAAALIVGDYARNEQVRLARFAEGPVITKTTVYQLTDELNPDSEYIIASTNVAGKTQALYTQGQGYWTITADSVVTDDGNNPPYILTEDADDTIVWYTFENEYGVGFCSKADNGVLLAYYLDYPLLNYGNMAYADGFMYKDNILYDMGYDDEHNLVPVGALHFDTYFLFSTTETGPVYLYEKTVLIDETDPEVVSEITIEPATTTLILGVDEERELKVSIKPITIEDKSVTWTSSDPEVATVDENGVVTAVSVGTVTITATSVQTPEASATALVNVVEATPMNAYINGQVSDADGNFYALIDLTDMTPYAMGEADAVLNGGRTGNYVYGIDGSRNLSRYLYDTETYEITKDEEFSASISKEYAMIDGASISNWKSPLDEETTLDYRFITAGVTESGKLVFYTEGTNLWYLEPGVENIVAMALIDYDSDDITDPSFYYALLTNDGTLYMYVVYGIVLDDGGIDVDGVLRKLGTVNGIAFGEDLTAYSMTCSYGHVFDSEGKPDTNYYGLFIADNTTKGIYYADLMSAMYTGETNAQFIGIVDGATNVSSLFNDTMDVWPVEDIGEATASVGREAVREFVKKTEPIATSKAVFVQLAEAEAKVEEPSEEPANEVTGTTNAVKGYQSGTVRINREADEPAAEEPVADEPAEAEGTVKVEIKAEDLTNNGLYTVTYDKDELEYVSTESDFEFKSINDSEEGKITFAFADLEGAEEGDVIATITFKAPCEDQEVTISVTEENEDLDSDKEFTETVEGVGHEWGEPEWTWSDDHSEATAKFTCENNENHVKEVTEKSVVDETPAEVGKEGKRVYKVTVTGPDGKEYSTEFEEVIPALPEPSPETSDASYINAWQTAFITSMVAIAFIFITMKKKSYFQR